MTPQSRCTQPVVWAMLGNVPLKVGVKLDSLTVIMFFMVTFIATWIHVFSVGYMAGHSDQVDHQSKYHRFFCYLSLFCFSMLGLVIANSLLFLFIFWELVGPVLLLADRVLLRQEIRDQRGDEGLHHQPRRGLRVHHRPGHGVPVSGRFHADAARPRACASSMRSTARCSPTRFAGITLATWMGCLLFCGAMGKSAQFPLHVWLPDAMAGPTPVSALIHAATMVAAGVYLVARIFVLLTPDAQLFIAIIGCITLTITALIAIVQTDIKKVLAYSTLSQLGYMMLGMGVGAWIAALFHLLTHAFFKALMFLGSGPGDRRLPPRAGHAQDGRPGAQDAHHLLDVLRRRAGHRRRGHPDDTVSAWAGFSARTRFSPSRGIARCARARSRPARRCRPARRQDAETYAQAGGEQETISDAAKGPEVRPLSAPDARLRP